MEQILDESDAVGLMQLQCKEAKDDASVMIFPTTDTLALQKQVRVAERTTSVVSSCRRLNGYQYKAECSRATRHRHPLSAPHELFGREIICRLRTCQAVPPPVLHETPREFAAETSEDADG